MTDKKSPGDADPNEYERTLYPDLEPFPPETRKVGYCNPPTETRFQPGKSGNPKGRPKRRKNFKSAFKDILTEKIRVRIGNKVTRRTKLEAVLIATLDKAIKGEAKAIQHITATAKALGLLDDAPSQELVVGNLSHFSREELLEFLRLMEKADGTYRDV